MNSEDKVIQNFNNVFMYDTNLQEGPDGYSWKRRIIKVEQEVITEGSTTPVYIVRYPDGSTAYVNKDMYYESQLEADTAFLAELYNTKKYLDDNIADLEKTRKEINIIIEQIKETILFLK
jgi:hypothetical protein